MNCDVAIGHSITQIGVIDYIKINCSDWTIHLDLNKIKLDMQPNLQHSCMICINADSYKRTSFTQK